MAAVCGSLEPAATADFSAVEVAGYRGIEQAQLVELAYETAQQDSFDYRATSARMIDG